MREPTARQALEAFLDETLAGLFSTHGYAVTGLAFAQAIEITLAKGGATFVLWLRPVSDESSCYKQTARFKVGHDPDPPDRLGYSLIDAVCAKLAAWETSLSGAAQESLFEPRPTSPAAAALTPEWVAVRAGLKPACRYVVNRDGAGSLLEQALGHDLWAVRTEADAFVADFCSGGTENTSTIVHIARTIEAANAAAAAERAMIETCNRGERATVSQVRALGAALGYPDCCIEAFLPVRDCSNTEIHFQALRRTPPGPASLLLNNIVPQALVTHSLCRYDCPPSLRYGRALLEELARLNSAVADELARGLAGVMVVFRSEGALRLTPTAATGAGPLRFAALEAVGEGATLETWRTALRAADGLEVLEGEVRVLHGVEETCRLSAPPDDIQLRRFA